MSQLVECPTCGRKINLPDDSANKKVTCRGCESTNRIHATDGGSLFLTCIEETVEPSPEVRAPASRKGSRSSPSSRGNQTRSGRQSRSRGNHRTPDGASTVLIVGILSLVLCAFLGPVAWVMGNSYLEKCKRARVRPEGGGVAGRVLGIIATALMVFALIWFIFLAASFRPMAGM